MLNFIRNLDMLELNTWNILTWIAILSLIVFFNKKKNAVWGGLFGGIFIGIIWALIFLLKGEGWQWKLFLHGIIIGVLLGLVAELLGKIGNLLNRKK